MASVKRKVKKYIKRNEPTYKGLDREKKKLVKARFEERVDEYRTFHHPLPLRFQHEDLESLPFQRGQKVQEKRARQKIIENFSRPVKVFVDGAFLFSYNS